MNKTLDFLEMRLGKEQAEAIIRVLNGLDVLLVEGYIDYEEARKYIEEYMLPALDNFPQHDLKQCCQRIVYDITTLRLLKECVEHVSRCKDAP